MQKKINSKVLNSITKSSTQAVSKAVKDSKHESLWCPLSSEINHDQKYNKPSYNNFTSEKVTKNLANYLNDCNCSDEEEIKISNNSNINFINSNINENEHQEDNTIFHPLQHTKISEERSHSNTDNILSKKFFSFFWLIVALLLGFVLFFKKFSNGNTFSNKDLESCKEKLRKLKLLNKKLLKKISKNILKRGKTRSNKSRNKVKKAKICKEERNKFRDIIEAKTKGRRIIDFNYLWKELRLKLQTHDSKKCRLDDWVFQREVSFHGGLRSQFFFKCRKCNKECRIWSEGVCNDTMGINQASVLGTLVEGIGYTQINGILAGMGIPYITDKTFKNNQETLYYHLLKN